MSLLEVYLACMVFGGIFVVLSVVSGGGEADADADFDADMDADADFDADLDADVDADVDADFDADFDADLDADVEGVGGGDIGLADAPFEFDLEGAGIDAEGVETGGGSMDVETGARGRFNPLFSFKFWTFGLAFFGLTGFVFEQFDLWASSIGVFVLSLAMGSVAGLFVSYGLRLVDQAESSAGITERDYLGASAEVLIPIEAERTGKVRMRIKGKTIDMRAKAFDEGEGFESGETCFVLGLDEEGVQVVDVETVKNELVKKT